MKIKSNWKEDELTCKPLDSYNEILTFLENPPSWRSLCKELHLHSKKIIKNIELNRHYKVDLDSPHIFCHFDPDADDVERHNEKDLPKTLVCHDMANGYHDDSIIDGTGQYDAYTFYNWASIDIFCYFSHHLITIPPLGWINVGHAHGVKVIGTVITEWAEGITFWDKVLETENEYKNFASALVAIAKTLKFDGWLLNVENKVSKPDKLLEFVRYLHKILHQELASAVLIWYDSVTVDGHLNWQNGLNTKNKDFFDACDGLFTNYSWTKADVASSAQAAGDRLTDLYIGIDVWGRNFYGGGQFNTQQAIEVAYSNGCSLAIFAPAWTHEAMSQDKSDLNAVAVADDLDVYEQFLLRDRALWGSIWAFLNTRLPCNLPFQTSFCRGQGKKRRLYGEVLCPVPWYNLRHMQYQPNANHGPHGYVLSTLDNILAVSRKCMVKDPKGIIKYRESFLTSRLALHSIRSKEGNVDQNGEESPSTIDEVNEQQEDNLVENSESEPKTVKRRMKNAIKYLFKKSHKQYVSDEEEATAETDERARQDSESGPSGSTGLPMVQMSVNLRLGHHREKTRYALASVPDELECLEVCLEDSYIGGSCLKVNPSDSLSPEHRMTRIFHCDFHCKDTLVVCIVTKTLIENEDQFLNIKLHAKNANGEDLKVVLVGRDMPGTQQEGPYSGIHTVYPLSQTSDAFRSLQKYLLLKEPGFYVSVENPYGWTVRYYEVQTPSVQVSSVNCRTGMEKGAILLGYFGLCHRPYKSEEDVGTG
ncbi:cytosolic endo-beta-N-acetylglucosaminidase [Aphomia sociella]